MDVSPGASNDPLTRKLGRGDLVRISEVGKSKGRRLEDREGHLGRISAVVIENGEEKYDVEWILGGRLAGLLREDLIYTTAEQEGMTASGNRRKRKQPANFAAEIVQQDEAKKKSKTPAKNAVPKPSPKKATPTKAATKASKNNKAASKPKAKAQKRSTASSTAKKTAKKQKVEQQAPEPPKPAMDLYERQRREFERIFSRFEEKVDRFGHFRDDEDGGVPPEFDEKYGDETTEEIQTAPDGMHNETDAKLLAVEASLQAELNQVVGLATEQPDSPNSQSSKSPYPSHAPYNWKMIRRRMEHGRYVLDREKKEEEERFKLLGPYYATLGRKEKAKRQFSNASRKPCEFNPRVAYPVGVNWELFRDDVLAMCDAAVDRETEDTDDETVRGSLRYSVKKIKDELALTYGRTGLRHAAEMATADDRHKFALAVEKRNTEAAMQSWKKEPYPERRYERLASDVVSAGLSEVDERIASYELRTSLPDSFIGLAYRYDDTGQSEAWMKSVVDETGSEHGRKKKKAQNREDEEIQAALAIAADDGVTRAQVNATMQSLLISVQDRVMTEGNVLRQPELRSANWLAGSNAGRGDLNFTVTEDEESGDCVTPPLSPSSSLSPEVVEKPVWGIDCYTRRNISHCLQTEFDEKTALIFIEKWLLPAINVCPDDLAHDIANAARVLEGLPFEEPKAPETDEETAGLVAEEHTLSVKQLSQTLLGRALMRKIQSSAPPFLAGAANLLRRARAALGPDFFRVHPKGHGSVLLTSKLKPNTLVTFYRGEVYPSWRWGEKMDAIDITQRRKSLKPALPDFYNMVLERPQMDPRGYGLLFVDASRKAGHGSSISHSCAPTCEVRVAALNGELCLAMTTLRELEMGEELTFDYNAVTESLNEYRSAVCLCGYGKCRGSFLHFATADCYQQIMNRNSPIATRFSSLVKGSMKKVMSEDDERVLKSHGFLTAAFGAISVNRHENTGDGDAQTLVDSFDMVPVWLRTYVADTLRYIEYERRALPIALICDHLATAKEDAGTEVSPSVPTKEPKPEPSFFYFSRTQAGFLKKLLEKEGIPESMQGLQLRHLLQKTASSYWQGLSEEEKLSWKKKARADYEKKLKAWQVSQRGSQKGKGKPSKGKKGGKNKKPGMSDVLLKSEISFQDADAEGVSAMEQRIQQLTQSLSRVGRVLDRHREATLESDPTPSTAADAEDSRKHVHSPLSVLGDGDVVGWMWNSKEGAVPSLLRSIEFSNCTRPVLLRKLGGIRTNYKVLETFGDPTSAASGDVVSEPISTFDGRRLLKQALVEMRATILDELKQMAKEFRRFESESRGDTEAIASADESDSQNEEETVSASENLETGGQELESLTDHYTDKVEQHVGESPSASSGNSESASGRPAADSAESIDVSKATENMQVPVQSNEWLEHYGDRFTLHAAADLLLLFAHTSNYFLLKPYESLTSTPIEVYARELGNAVPRTVIDPDLANDMNRLHPETTDSSHLTASEAESSSEKGQTDDLCLPDDIVAKVSVKYRGDFVLSQLLQWNTSGIGQKPGLPDLLGCVRLPSMSSCWLSHLLHKNKLNAKKKTTYETKVRPSLVEWLQDPYQRGNPWPEQIRRAFVGKDANRDESTSFLALGSPVVDFLVTGDESNIFAVLDELDADDKVRSRQTADGLLSSVDKGRPAQAVSTWVQCENPDCMKWRKIPWHVDADLLPEKFFCKDNKWNPLADSCDAPEDDWDGADALVGADGKVEGSPARKKDHTKLSPLNQEDFTIGARFDVQRERRTNYALGTVTKVDFSGSIKRICFHFAKTSADRDEWIEFGSPRIAVLGSMNPKNKRGGKTGKAVRPELKNGQKGTIQMQSREAEAAQSLAELTAFYPNRQQGKVPKKLKKRKVVEPKDPADESSFTIGARFDVMRLGKGKDKYYAAVVRAVNFGGEEKRILFHFPKTSEKFDEWIEFGSPRICALNSKVPFQVNEKKKPKKPAPVNPPPNSLYADVKPARTNPGTNIAELVVAQYSESRSLPQANVTSGWNIEATQSYDDWYNHHIVAAGSRSLGTEKNGTVLPGVVPEVGSFASSAARQSTSSNYSTNGFPGLSGTVPGTTPLVSFSQDDGRLESSDPRAPPQLFSRERFSESTPASLAPAAPSGIEQLLLLASVSSGLSTGSLGAGGVGSLSTFAASGTPQLGFGVSSVRHASYAGQSSSMNGPVSLPNCRYAEGSTPSNREEMAAVQRQQQTRHYSSPFDTSFFSNGGHHQPRNDNGSKF